MSKPEALKGVAEGVFLHILKGNAPAFVGHLDMDAHAPPRLPWGRFDKGAGVGSPQPLIRHVKGGTVDLADGVDRGEGGFEGGKGVAAEIILVLEEAGVADFGNRLALEGDDDEGKEAPQRRAPRQSRCRAGTSGAGGGEGAVT